MLQLNTISNNSNKQCKIDDTTAINPLCPKLLITFNVIRTYFKRSQMRTRGQNNGLNIYLIKSVFEMDYILIF